MFFLIVQVSPESVLTEFKYNLFDNVTEITQSGKGKDNQDISLTEYRVYDTQQRLCKIKRADIGQTVFGYNNLNEMVWKDDQSSGGSNTNCTYTSPTNQRITYRNDNLGSKWLITYPNSVNGSDSFSVTYDLDNVGNLNNLDNGKVFQSFDYNSLNQLELETSSIDNKSFSLSYSYNTAGYLKSVTYPDGEYVENELTAFGEAKSAKRINNGVTEFTYASGASYYPNGALNTFNYGNGLTHKTELNNRKIPKLIKDYRAGYTALQNSYTYDNNMNVDSITDAVNASYSLSSLSYDGLDRLTATSGGTTIGSSTIQYDSFGNITQYISKGSSLSYTYNYTSNRLTSVDDTSSANNDYLFFNYDDAGNITGTSFNSLTYNRASNLTSANGTNTYVYDGSGFRVKSSESGDISYSLYGKDGKLYFRQTNAGSINYIFLGDKLIAKNGVIPENSGKQHYRPYGGSIEGETDDVGYTGHKFDKDIGLSYMQARYYDPVIGRFYSNDPVGTLGHLNNGSVQGFNRYAYANNNPYAYTDPDGQVPVLVRPIVIPPTPTTLPPVTPLTAPPGFPPPKPEDLELPSIEIPIVFNPVITGIIIVTDGFRDLLQNKIQEEWDTFEQAVGSVNPIPDRWYEGKTKDPDLRDEGFKEKHTGIDSEGVYQSAFKNPKTGKWTGGHESSMNDKYY